MIHASKKTAKIAEAAKRKQEAFENNDAEGFRRAVQDIEKFEKERHTFTCLDCGEDFDAEEDHIDILVAALAVMKKVDGVMKAIELADYGLERAFRGTAGRSIKFCQDCADKWPTAIHEYVELR